MFYADLLSFHNEGINASAVSAIDGDKLGLTTQEQQPETSQQERKGKETLMEMTSEGLGMAQKLFFIGVIVAVCFAFVKTRKGGRRGGKSMA